MSDQQEQFDEAAKEAALRQQIRNTLKMAEFYVMAIIKAATSSGPGLSKQLLLERERLVDEIVKQLKDDL